jgi:hypothetical protein
MGVIVMIAWSLLIGVLLLWVMSRDDDVMGSVVGQWRNSDRLVIAGTGLSAADAGGRARPGDATQRIG